MAGRRGLAVGETCAWPEAQGESRNTTPGETGPKNKPRPTCINPGNRSVGHGRQRATEDDKRSDRGEERRRRRAVHSVLLREAGVGLLLPLQFRRRNPQRAATGRWPAKAEVSEPSAAVAEA